MATSLHDLGKIQIACETYIVHNGRVLMHKRSETKEKFPGFWVGPGGKVDAGEDVLSAAIREVKEETGVSLDPKDVSLKVITFHHHIDRNEVWVEYLFRAEIPSDQEITSSSEGESSWIELDKVLGLEKLFPPSKYYLAHILDKNSGILYGSSEWENLELKKAFSERVDKNN